MNNKSTPVATLGSPTSHGGEVTTATAAFTIDGRKVARVGDKISCPEHGTGFITDGGFATIDGRHIAHHGSSTSCGATLIVSGGGPTV
ncbi:PAAR domain-containing protein [Advenella mimigardefordensis]|uniref:PAAR domain-containing protein n=1 Tax=Advenella mimigardefordensis TaxID=302406 RepID=UPI0009FE6409|nr:PAAR domain-containing protein [Advenella mimigardefordensis]